MEYLRIVTFNCRSVKTSTGAVQDLCKNYDIIILQETWLLETELTMLNSIDNHFYGKGRGKLGKTDPSLRRSPRYSSATQCCHLTLTYIQCRITNVGGLVQNFSGGLFSRRMGAPVSQTNAAGGSVQYSWGSGGRCKPTSGVRKRTHFGNNVYKICFVCKKNPLWGAPNCGGPGAAAPFAPLLIRHCIHLPEHGSAAAIAFLVG